MAANGAKIYFIMKDEYGVAFGTKYRNVNPISNGKNW